MDLNNITILLVLLLLMYLGRQAIVNREFALQKVLQHCRRLDLQLLDQAVALRAVWFKRDQQGKMRIWRSYRFEFTSTGEERYQGQISLLANHVLSIELEPYIISPSDDAAENSLH